MMRRLFVLLTFLVGATAAYAQKPPPQFQSQVDVLRVDVTVVDDRGKPIENLAAADFTVRVGGEPRRVVGAQWIARVTAATRSPENSPASVAADGYRSNGDAAGSGLVVIAVDEANIKFGAMRPLLPAVTRFIDRLPPADRIAIVSFGRGQGAWSDFTADRLSIKDKLAQMPGQRAATEPAWSHRVGSAAALAYMRNEPEALATVLRRACGGPQVTRGIDCPAEVRTEALKLGQELLHNADLTINSLRELLTMLRSVEAPKTLLLISDGFALDRTAGGQKRIAEVGQLAAASRTAIYSLKIEDEPLDITAPTARSPFEIQQDLMESRLGLELLAHASGGGLFTMSGTGTGPFDRIESELSGYYLIGVEPTARERDGATYPIEVAVARAGATVRARRTTTLEPSAEAQTPADRISAAFRNPLMLPAIPIRVTTYVFRGPDASKLQVFVYAAIGEAFTEPRMLTVGQTIRDASNRVVDGVISEMRLAPLAGVASPVQYGRTVTVDPGTHTIKIAVADGDLVGSVELRVRATLGRAGTLDVTDLAVGGPEQPADSLRPTLGPDIRFGLVQGYFEAYGREAAELTPKFEVAAREDGPALLSADAAARRVGDDRFIFSHTLSVADLPPGLYVLRALMSRGAAFQSRGFEVVAPPRPAGGSVFLTVSGRDLARDLDLDEVLQPSVTQTFRATISPAATTSFDEGLMRLRDRQYLPAATAFERVIDAGGDTSGALAYLGACFAAAGHDVEALAAWRRLTSTSPDLPDVHVWMVDALLRTKSYGEARAAAERALARWPDDARFLRSLALLKATAGNARDAIVDLARYLEGQPADEDSLLLAVNWLFQAKRGGLQIHEPGEAIRLARGYADRYAAGQGSSVPLVNLWVEYLAR